MDSGNPFKNIRQKPARRNLGQRGDGFFEALREIGSSTVKSLKNDVARDTAKNIVDQVVGSAGDQNKLEETPEFNFEEWLNAQEEKARSEERAFQEHKRQEEKVVFSFRDERLKKEIEAVRQELALLVSTIQQVEGQVEKAANDPVVEPGVYHLNFFEKLRSWLRLLRKNIQDSALWLEMWQSKSDKSHYWGMVGKKGTKFMLSHERYMSTQAG